MVSEEHIGLMCQCGDHIVPPTPWHPHILGKHEQMYCGENISDFG